MSLAPKSAPNASWGEQGWEPWRAGVGKLSLEVKAGAMPASRGVSMQKPAPHQHKGVFPPSLLFPKASLPFFCPSAASRHEDAVTHNDKNSQYPGMTSTQRASPLLPTV